MGQLKSDCSFCKTNVLQNEQTLEKRMFCCIAVCVEQVSNSVIWNIIPRHVLCEAWVDSVSITEEICRQYCDCKSKEFITDVHGNIYERQRVYIQWLILW